MSEAVFAVVVTFNRKELLAQCLDALRAQSRPLDGVIVIDNASTDGTDAWLSEQSDGGVDAYRLSRNTGGAGGFNAGMRLAYQAGADLLWIMDDDVIPEPTALQALLEARQTLHDRGKPSAFVASTAWTPDGLLTNVPDIDHRLNSLDYADWGVCLDRGMVAVRRSTFVSILFPRAVIETFGLPIAPMFIWADDSEYTVRVTRETPGYSVGPSRVLHVRAASGAPRLATETSETRIGFHRYMIRNTAYLTRTHYGRRALFDYWRGQLRLARSLALDGHLGKARVVIGGLIDSISFKPIIESAAEAPRHLDAEIVAIKPR